jgi:glycine cleavage system regulatory protein
MTILGKDRPGLVSNISKVIVEHGGNWLDSHLAEVAGYFGGLLHVAVSVDQLDSLKAALRGLESEGLEIIISPGPQDLRTEEGLEIELELVGNDKPGIINQVTDAIASHGANLLELETEYGSAPMSGQEIFKAFAKIQFPSQASLDELRRDLEKIAADLMVDISVQ